MSLAHLYSRYLRLKAANAFVIIMVLLTSCTASKVKFVKKELISLEHTFHNHTGFVLYDPVESEYLINYKADKYFTPASNTKILTLYTCLHLLGDSIPALKYVQKGDSLIFWGTGDPSFLHPDLSHSHAYDFLKQSQRHLYFSSANFFDDHFGPGWAWDDYPYTFSSERSPFPVFGNYFTVKKDASQKLSITNPVFKKYFWLNDSSTTSPAFVRSYESNSIDYFPQHQPADIAIKIPFRYSDQLVAEILSDTLNKKVLLTDEPMQSVFNTAYSLPADSVYKRMMQVSDNMMAEQLLLVCSAMVGDSLRVQNAIDYALNNVFKDIDDELIWKDGSGLSRYNLFTPRSIVNIWEQLLTQYGRERLFNILAVGGESGTLKNYYKSEIAYIYGKTGTLSNNHSLSGFLITKSGRLLIFSLMNNNYAGSSIPVKKRMEQILLEVHEKF
ncbi:MAG: D-alanyl-D-alanine carboxypeptidase [Bacteroidota bacterium]